MRFILALLICAFATVACAEDLSFVVACAADGKCGTAIGPTRIEGKVARSAMAQCKKLSLRPNSCRGAAAKQDSSVAVVLCKKQNSKDEKWDATIGLGTPGKDKSVCVIVRDTLQATLQKGDYVPDQCTINLASLGQDGSVHQTPATQCEMKDLK